MTAREQISKLVNELNAKFPQAKLSFGYIGNIERWGDDRGWNIWAKGFQTTQGFYAGNPPAFEFGTVGTDELDHLASRALIQLEKWIASLFDRTDLYVRPE
jgi:hypothetical protein